MPTQEQLLVQQLDDEQKKRDAVQQAILAKLQSSYIPAPEPSVDIQNQADKANLVARLGEALSQAATAEGASRGGKYDSSFYQNLIAQNNQRVKDAAAQRAAQQTQQDKQQQDLLKQLQQTKQESGQALKTKADILNNIANREVKSSQASTEPTEAQKSVDRSFGKDYAEYIAGGGSANAEKNLKQLQSVANSLGKSDNISGPVIGSMPDLARKIFVPGSVSAQSDLEDVVQRSMKSVLGAQFTEREGQQLLKRAFDPQMSEEVNAVRVGRLLKSLQEAAKAKAAAAQYYEQHGTLSGYHGPTFDPYSIDLESGGQDSPKKPVHELSDEELNARIKELQGP